MKFPFILKVLWRALAPIPDTLPKQSNPTPSFPVNRSDSQLLANSTPPNQSHNQAPSSPVSVPLSQSPSHPLPLVHSISIPLHQRDSPSSHRNTSLPFPMIQRSFHSPDHPLPPPSPPIRIPVPLSRGHPRQDSPSSHRNQTLHFPMIQQSFHSPDHHPLPPPSPPIRIPWYRGNEFMAMEPSTHGPLPHEFHTMDRISLCVVSYFFACGLSYTSTWSQRPSLSTSIHIQCFLNQAAFSLFLLANALFPRTRPALAFVLDRLSFLLTVISAYLASMPMFPPYVAVIMFLVVAIVYIFARFRG